MGDRARAWGVQRTYTGFRGDAVTPPEATVAAILGSMDALRKRRPKAGQTGAGESVCHPAPVRAWGWAVQMYAVRSRDSWGIGDLADLRRLGRWARAAGASVILINPLGAQAPLPHQEPCPYYSSSRRFLNLLYLRVEDVAGADRCAAELAPIRAAGRALNSTRLIDHDIVFKLKNEALSLIYRAEPRPAGLSSWVKRQGRGLRDFATFNAVAEVRGASWRGWPERLRHPRAAGINDVQQKLAERIAFHEWVQFHLHKQLARAESEITLIADVPVGFASDGSDAWRWQDLMAPGMRVGAPPDSFFPDGQDWGMPAFDPWKLRAAHLEPYVEAIRSAAAQAGGLRLDHVMSLFRLFWIPDTANAAAGAYVRYPSKELLEILASESQRAGAFVIGEDLGLVEKSVRTEMRRRHMLGYRLLWFDETDPASWPRDSVAAITTHDLPTIAGIWRLSEPDQREHHMRHRLVDVSGMPDGADAVDVAVACYTRLASARSRLALATLEDALGVDERPNHPGTTTEFPNWRLAIPQSLEEFEHADGPRRIAEAMASARRSARSAG